MKNFFMHCHTGLIACKILILLRTAMFSRIRTRNDVVSKRRCETRSLMGRSPSKLSSFCVCSRRNAIKTQYRRELHSCVYPISSSAMPSRSIRTSSSSEMKESEGLPPIFTQFNLYCEGAQQTAISTERSRSLRTYVRRMTKMIWHMPVDYEAKPSALVVSILRPTS